MTQPDKLLVEHVAFEMFQHSSNRQSGKKDNLKGLWDLLPDGARHIWRDNATNAIKAVNSYKKTQ